MKKYFYFQCTLSSYCNQSPVISFGHDDEIHLATLYINNYLIYIQIQFRCRRHQIIYYPISQYKKANVDIYFRTTPIY